MPQYTTSGAFEVSHDHIYVVISIQKKLKFSTRVGTITHR